MKLIQEYSLFDIEEIESYQGLKTKSFSCQIYESAPQKRVLNFDDFYGNPVKRHFDLPYLYFIWVIEKRIYKNGTVKYHYSGLSACNLSIYCSKNQIQNANEPLCYLPIEVKHKGLVCIDHNYDNLSYLSLENMMNTVLAEWYSSNHYFDKHVLKSHKSTNVYKDYPNFLKKHNSIAEILINKFSCQDKKLFEAADAEKVTNHMVNEYAIYHTEGLDLVKQKSLEAFSENKSFADLCLENKDLEKNLKYFCQIYSLKHRMSMESSVWL